MSKESINPVIAEGKIRQALTRLGISFIDAMNLVQYKEDVETAYWTHNQETGKESICVGSEIASLDISSIEMVIRHEFLHRATYHGFHESFKDAQLLNIVEDVCINRLLYEAYPEKMIKLSVQVYSEEAKKTIIALADCSADPKVLEKGLSELWLYIWDKDEHGGYSSLNPTSLYYRLLEVRETSKVDFDVQVPIFPKHESKPDIPSRTVQTTMESIIQDIGGSLPVHSSSGSVMNTFLSTNNHFNSDIIKNFLRSFHVDRIITNSKDDLIESIRSTVNNAFPLMPSRLGLLYLTTGISDLLGIYNNTYIETRTVKLKLCFYIDVSGSMSGYFSQIHHFVKAVYDVPLAVKIFDVELRDTTVEEFESGNFLSGGGTDFDVVIKDILEDSTIGAGLLFTDGEADITDDLKEKLKASPKKIFVVYFSEKGSSTPHSVLDQIAEKILHIEV